MALNSIDRTNSINQSAVNSNRAGTNAPILRGGGEGSNVTINARDLGLSTGQTFSGQVVEVNGNEIKLLLDSNQTINAKLDGNLNAILGQVISFEVSSTEGGQTSLRPLYTNLSNMTAISNALQSAGLPETAQYVRMVSSMMDESMPVNKDALWNMAKNVTGFPNTDPATVVQLSKLSLPINELNVNQLENYKNFEHQVKNDILNISKGMVDLMDEGLHEANPEFYESLTKSQGENIDGLRAAANRMNNLFNAFMNVVSGNNEVDNKITDVSQKVMPNELVEGELVEGDELVAVEEEPFNSNGLKFAGQILELVENSSEPSITLVSDKLNNIMNELMNSISENTQTVEATEENTANNITGDTENNGEMLATEKNIQVKNYSFDELLNSVKDILKNINLDENSISNDSKRMLSELLSDNEFKTGIKDALSKQLSLKPEDLTGNDKIQDLYNKILRQSQAAIDILNNAGKDNPDIFKAAQNINDNVNFMNQLNQAVTYIQLPLLMNNKAAHGDLYVYTNKKNLQAKDGNLSAFLHLDMENLGPMDIYASLTNGTKVNTHFYLQDEATIDFIAKHIDILNERLTKKGYDMNTNISVKEKGSAPVNVAEEFMKETPNTTHRMAAKLSFDVRA